MSVYELLMVLSSQLFKMPVENAGLLNDDKEWHEVINEAAKAGFAPQIRQLFVHIIVNS